MFLKGDSSLIKNFSRPSSIPQVIAAIAGAELPNGHWGEVIQALATNATDVWNRFLSAWITLFSGKSRSEIRANKRSLHRSYWLHLQRRQTRAPECPVKPNSYLHLLRTCKSIEKSLKTDHLIQLANQNQYIRQAAITALFNSLEFVKINFEKENERSHIMQVVCNQTVKDPNNGDTDITIRTRAMECLVKIAMLYYEVIGFQLEKLMIFVAYSKLHAGDL